MRRRLRAVAVMLLVSPVALPAARGPVLKQVDLPHSYYWREM
ncbi:MAG: hypothetical protein ACRETT_06035 [Steroidobacteraceae bacterium]